MARGAAAVAVGGPPKSAMMQGNMNKDQGGRYFAPWDIDPPNGGGGPGAAMDLRS